jgi:lipopolysaccharide transport system ATP-binding protein
MPAVTFDSVSKCFNRHAGQILLRDRLMRLMQPSVKEPFWALRDVSFSVEPGGSLGILGRNGAGKSTLLNIATGLCKPTKGKVQIPGRVAALLELGSGFHQDLTGRENVHINAAMLGLSRQQVRQRFDEIVEFSGIGEFIDEPQRTYSSGMTVRLAFSVAINVDPDVLIIDEVLGVGDQAFFAKCFERLLDFRRAGKTLICVSHSTESLRQLCDDGLWLHHGKVMKMGPIGRVLEAYVHAGDTTATPAGPI